ncbi:MAG: septum site-determining protein MinC [Candidatus Muiribacteriota bacterium]|jgi:septum site-determining protein MinC
MYEEKAVTLQRIRSGLYIVLDDRIPFYNLKKLFYKKLQSMDSYIFHTNVIMNFGSREMRDSDLKEIITLGEDNFKLNLLKIITKVPELKEIAKKRGYKAEDFIEKSELEFSEDVLNEDTLWIKKSIRSGQLTEYRGNVVVLGDVNVGARIIAGGNILVMGVLRGDVWAGKDGNLGANVISSFFGPSQLRIYDTYLLKSEEILKEIKENMPAVAFLKNNTIFVKEYKEWSLRGAK